METFTKQVTFLSKVAKEATDNQAAGFVLEAVTKTATFKELSQTDRSQHKLHFKIISLFRNAIAEQAEGEKANIRFDDDAVYDFTTKFINQMMQVSPEFNEQDKIELLNDSGALFTLGYSLLGDKVTPFFSQLMSSLAK